MGDTIAVFGIDIDTHNLGDTLNYRHIYPSSFVFLLTEEGELIAGPTDPTLQKKVEELACVINDSTIEKPWYSEGRIRIATRMLTTDYPYSLPTSKDSHTGRLPLFATTMRFMPHSHD